MRPIWKGSISFGLVNIPVALYSASRKGELKFKLLHKKDLSEVRYARICKADGKEIPWEEIVKGYPTKEGEYAVMTEEDFQQANLKRSKTIEILSFTYEKDIDTIYYDTPYYLEPEKGSRKAYQLLYEALKKSKKTAISQFIFHHHEHLGVIRPHDNLLILHQLHYHSELIPTKELEIPPTKISNKELNIALKLIDELSHPFEPKQYSDTYIEEIKELIQKKKKGKRLSHPKSPRGKSPKIQDIMDLLKLSLKEKKRKSA